MDKTSSASAALVRHFTDSTSTISVAWDAILNGGDPNGCLPDGLPILVMACLQERALTVERLLDAGANPNSGGPYNIRPFLAALHVENRRIVKRLLRAGANPLLGAGGGSGSVLDQFGQEHRLARAVERLVRLRQRRWRRWR
jgi:ankyrin repeat protein